MARSSERPSRKPEQEAIVTTIVGGRPPGCGTKVGDIPRGIEVLVKKAAVDAEFKAVLIDLRADAAKAIDLALDPAEAAMLRAIPASQLEAIVSSTRVDAKLRPALLGKAAAVMIAALGAGGIGCGPMTVDLDGDGLRDAWEVEHFGAPDQCDPDADSDSDGLDNSGEHEAGTDPLDPDTDGDGHNDGEEVAYGTNPLNAASWPAILGPTRGIRPARLSVTDGIRPDRPFVVEPEPKQPDTR